MTGMNRHEIVMGQGYDRRIGKEVRYHTYHSSPSVLSAGF